MIIFEQMTAMFYKKRAQSLSTVVTGGGGDLKCKSEEIRKCLSVLSGQTCQSGNA